mgnify:CR=1 FL=1
MGAPIQFREKNRGFSLYAYRLRAKILEIVEECYSLISMLTPTCILGIDRISGKLVTGLSGNGTFNLLRIYLYCMSQHSWHIFLTDGVKKFHRISESRIILWFGSNTNTYIHKIVFSFPLGGGFGSIFEHILVLKIDRDTWGRVEGKEGRRYCVQ